MSANPIVHVIGTGTIGEPLIGLPVDLKESLGFEEVTFHKRTPLLTDRSKVLSLVRRGAKLAVDAPAAKGFEDLGMSASYEAIEAIERAGVIGLPAPGTELKFVPNGSKLELRVRGPNVTPGYYRRDDLTEAAPGSCAEDRRPG